MPYTEEQKLASNRYSSIKARVAYKLEEVWPREDFINWLISKEKKCCYCGCTQCELEKFYENNESKRKRTRGKTLEIERKEDKAYSSSNCELSCYWCNNAKSDVFSFDEFLPIGFEIGKAIRSITK